MIRYQYNDGGRKEAGYKGHTGDCVARALAISTGKPYKEIYDFVGETMKSHGYKRSANAYYSGNHRRGMRKPKLVQEDIIRSFGFEKVKLPKGPRPTYRQAYEQYGDCMVATRGHILAIKDGAVQDIFDDQGYWWCYNLEIVRSEPHNETCCGWRYRKALVVWVKEK